MTYCKRFNIDIVCLDKLDYYITFRLTGSIRIDFACDFKNVINHNKLFEPQVISPFTITIL